MREDRMQVALQLNAGADADAQELDELTARLRRQLLELDVDSVERLRAGEAPPGTRAADVMALGALVVTLAKSPELLKLVVGTVQSWLAARQGRSIELEVGGDKLKLTGLSSEEQRRLIDLFVARHAG